MKMTSMARKVWGDRGYTCVRSYKPKEYAYLDSIACQRNEDLEKLESAWIFEDGSAVILGADENCVDDDYGKHQDHIKLNN